MYDTHGLPVSMILDACLAKNIVPSWLHFYEEAFKAGWTHKKIIAEIGEALLDVFEKDYHDIVINNLTRYAAQRKDP